eukprot:2771551-Prymnesium_polylepis.3
MPLPELKDTLSSSISPPAAAVGSARGLHDHDGTSLSSSSLHTTERTGPASSCAALRSSIAPLTISTPTAGGVPAGSVSSSRPRSQ